MGKLNDLSGQKFGRLTVLSRSRIEKKNILYFCTCECNPNKIIEKYSSCIKFSKYPSCDCWYKEVLKKYNEFKLLEDYGICFIGENEFLFDIEDYELIKNISWANKEGYAFGRLNHEKITMHRFVMNCPKDKIVDHLNGNTKDNRKSNLRITTQTENCRNIKKKQENTSSKYIGVHKSGKRWAASIGYNRKHYYLGTFDTEEEAALAYNKKAEELGYLTRNIINDSQ